MPDILHRVGIKSSPENVFDALTTEKGLASWWTKDTKAEQKIGAKLKFRFGDKGNDMEVLDMQPSKFVKWRCISGPNEWIDTEINFELKKENDYTIVLFSHRNWKEQSELMAHCSCKWGCFMLSLKSYLEEGKGTPFPNDRKIDNWN